MNDTPDLTCELKLFLIENLKALPRESRDLCFSLGKGGGVGEHVTLLFPHKNDPDIHD